MKLYQQVRITVAYTRDAKILNRFSQDDAQRGSLSFALNATWDTLMQTPEPGGEPGTPEGESK